MNYNSMRKDELVALLREINADDEVQAFAKVLAAVDGIKPLRWDGDETKSRKRGQIKRVFQHVAARYGVTL